MTNRSRTQGRIAAAFAIVSMLAVALYACGGDDASSEDAGGDASVDGIATDSSFVDRVGDSASTDGASDASDAGDTGPFLPNVPFECGSTSCDFGTSGCCQWLLPDAASGQECLPIADFEGGAVIPCNMGVGAAVEALCYRTTDCPGADCLIFPIRSDLIGATCTDSGIGEAFSACDPSKPCDPGQHCYRATCGPNEMALCLNDDAGAIDAGPGGCIFER